ncbi:hypothetical protein SAMN05443575_1097 [Jatrophihabitans endophyticus]|uniref:Uncharacterized protein n=1 Tax=Jatrophihabitans endophyticus TaxID=1206085 RepID=A0A1M5G955_9ACTN|nr:hypothetical protein [Jatrophihabitans endophyticus]SHG00208.1 hypothetical protein SAMN05443575_1097 [Jatrophihabitans endophyticus]
MTSSAAAIIPITLTVNDRTGLTLWAPPWEDEDGDEWQGFLGDGQKILLYPNTADLAAFIASGEENDLSDHPGWGQVLKATPDELRPSTEDRYDLDAVYEWAGGEPDPVHVSALADVVDMVAKIADCCDDGKLRRLVEGTPAFAELVDEENTYQGRDGRKRWNELGDTIAESWERAIARVEDWLNWRGDFSESEFDEQASVWERVGAEPIELRFADATYLTVRGDVSVDADGDETATAFLGDDQQVVVFTDLADLARYCREAEEHRLVKLEWWSELADVTDDADFAPAADAAFDLRKPSSAGAGVLRQLAEFCGLEADTDVLDGPDVDKDDWADLVAEVRSCLRDESS